MSAQPIPRELFYSYADADENLCIELDKHLSQLRRDGLIAAFHKRQITAGQDWTKILDQRLGAASIILLLVSADFLASDYCYGVEVMRAMEQHRAGIAHVIPLLLRPCDWKSAPFGHLQALPSDGNAVTSWSNRDSAFADIVRGIRRAFGLKQVGPVSSDSVGSAPPSALSSRTRQALWQMLHKEYRRQLSQTLPGAALLVLGLHERTDLTRSPTQLVFRRTNEEHPLPPGTSIVQVYDDAGQGLLILGEPGAGKTTLLLDLAQELLRRSENDESQPLPFIVNVSSWGKMRSSLSPWLIEELSRAYDIPKALGKVLLNSNQVLFLLDGLDEVIRASRAACIEAINSYKRTHFGPLVICSRSREYMEQQARLTVPTAVVVQPLLPEQVMSYLKRLGKPLAAVRAVLQTNRVLAGLLTTPLLLNVVILAYRGKTVKDLPQLGGAEEQQQEIFRCYVEQMLSPRGEFMPYPQEHMRHWLSWLAEHMYQSSQSVHYIEQLQPDWLSPRSAGWYTWLGRSLPGIVIGTLTSIGLMTLLFGSSSLLGLLSMGILGGLCGGLLSSHTPVQPVSHQMPVMRGQTRGRRLGAKLLLAGGVGLSIGWLAFFVSGWPVIWASPQNSFSALSYGICFTLGSFLLLLILPWQQHKASLKRSRRSPSKKGRFVQIAGPHLRSGLWIGLIIGLCFALSVWLSSRHLFGLRFGLSFGFLGFALSLLLRTEIERVLPREIIVWSWPRLFTRLGSLSHVRITLLVSTLTGLLFGLSYGLSYGLNEGLTYWLNEGLTYWLNLGLGYGLSLGLSFGLSYWCIMGIYGSISSTIFEDHRRVTPNQGIRRSGRNGLILGSISGMIACVVSALNNIMQCGIDITASNPVDLARGLALTLQSHLGDSIIIGLSAACLAGLLFGGLAYYQHYVLRWLFFRERNMPWRDPQFLEESVKHILLKRVGGGYSFIHPLFQEYFATLE